MNQPMPMNQLEILAPAGGQEQLIAAVRSGADAVYLGLDGFNARQNAHNFDDPRAIVSYCHARGVKVHFTVNTLVNDAEIPALTQTLSAIAQSGADAVIVQDLAVAKIVRECCPGLALHASTQMTVHNLPGVRALEQLGFSRAVLSRELTLEEIQRIAENTNLEIEVFVHGALCMSMSGACYLSSVLGGRSGNRGYCAQPCRLDFSCRGRRFALSLKDMCHIPHLSELAHAGVCSLKIEGRMKRPEYVAAAVDACRKQLAGESPDFDTLSSVFSRSGFTDGYLAGKRTSEMFGYRTKEDVTATSGVLNQLTGLYKDERKSLPVTMEVTVLHGQPAVLTAACQGRSATVSGAVPQPAQNRPLDEEILRKQLCKTGGTPYFVENLTVNCGAGLNLPLPELNRLRREALSALTKQGEAITPHSFTPKELAPPAEHQPPARRPALFVRCETAGQLTAIWGADGAKSQNTAGRYLLPAEEILKNPEIIPRCGEKLFAVIPQIFWDDRKMRQTLEKLLQLNVKNALADNLGGFFLAKELGFRVAGGHGLNILNSLSLAAYEEMGITDATLSFELSAARLKALHGRKKRGILAYGHLPLMQLRTCPGRGKDGCGNCDGHPAVTDRKGNLFPLLCHGRQFSTLLNPIPLDLRGRPVENVDFYTLWFTTEPPETCREIYRAYCDEKGMHCNPEGKYTRGLYYKEIL